jgi:hypothetical protein
MGSPVAEFGSAFWWFHGSSARYTGGLTRTVDFNLIPGDLSVHTGLSRVQGTTSGPPGAGVGIVEFTPVGGPTVSFDPGDAESWIPHLYAKTGSFTVGFSVVRARMTCWVFFQVWG